MNNTKVDYELHAHLALKESTPDYDSVSTIYGMDNGSRNVRFCLYDQNALSRVH